MGRSSVKFAVAAIMVMLLAACEGADIQPAPHSIYDPKDQARRDRYGTVLGSDGITLSTGDNADEQSGAGGGGIGVNAYLWRGTLDTIDFIPLASADPFGGLIITDWYQPAGTPGERFKLNILIKDAVLRADGLKVSLFRQVSDGQGGWLDTPVDKATERALEDKILTKARELRIAEIGETG